MCVCLKIYYFVVCPTLCTRTGCVSVAVECMGELDKSPFLPVFFLQFRDDNLHSGEASAGRYQALAGSRRLHVSAEC